MPAAELFEACYTLFGSEIDVSIDFLRYLQLSGIKAAYRQKALETHPDRARTLGRDEMLLGMQFREATDAYEKLRAYLNSELILIPPGSQAPPQKRNPRPAHSQRREPGYRKRRNERTKARHRTAPNRNKKPKQGKFFTGPLPARPLMLGQFLYYSGHISWDDFIKALIWQKRQRPLMGRIALEWGFLNPDDIPKILRQRHLREKFGQSALRMGFLSHFELLALIGKQKMLQRPLGEYFVRKGVLSRFELERLLVRQQHHNQRFPKTG